jgi:hypothetical protein
MSTADRHTVNHEEASRLLPWLVNGTLPRAEREQVERHVRDCLSCRAELREQQALKLLVQRHPHVHFSAEQGFAELARQLEAAPQGPPRADELIPQRPRADELMPPGPHAGGVGPQGPRTSELGRNERGAGDSVPPRRFARAAAFLAHIPRGRRLVVANAAALAAIAGVAVWLSVRGPADEPAYSTLTQPQPLDDGTQLDIVFAPGTTQAAMHEVLGDIDATIVAGPSGVGRYTVRLASPPSDAELDDIIGRLLADSRVRFAGRAFTAPGGAQGAEGSQGGEGSQGP